MAKMTAIEWFWIHLPEKISKEYFDLFEQAKAMEKEQIMHAYWNGTTDMDKFDALTYAEKFYNEYYGA